MDQYKTRFFRECARSVGSGEWVLLPFVKSLVIVPWLVSFMRGGHGCGVSRSERCWLGNLKSLGSTSAVEYRLGAVSPSQITIKVLTSFFRWDKKGSLLVTTSYYSRPWIPTALDPSLRHNM